MRYAITGIASALSLALLVGSSQAEELVWLDGGNVGGVANFHWFYACTGQKVNNRTVWRIKFYNERSGPVGFDWGLSSSPLKKETLYGECILGNTEKVIPFFTSTFPDDVPCTGNPYIRPIMVAQHIEIGGSNDECK